MDAVPEILPSDHFPGPGLLQRFGSAEHIEVRRHKVAHRIPLRGRRMIKLRQQRG